MSVFAISDGVDIPGWTNTLLTNDDTFDVQAAKQEAESVQPVNVSSTGEHPASATIPSRSSHSSNTPGSGPTSSGGTLAQSDPASQSSSTPSPTDTSSRNTDSLPNNDVQTGSSLPSSASGDALGPQPAGTMVPGQPPSPLTTSSYSTGASQRSESAASSSQTDGRAQPSTSLPPTSDSMRSARSSSSRLGAIIAGAVGGVVLLLIAAFVALCVVRRRRRRREAKEALIASGPLEWWMRPGGAPIWHPDPDPEQSECRTIRPESEDAESEMATLPGDDVSEKKSVKYGNYPDF
ncbi:hypothetical protein GY45DRAFT_1367343 [Cubamyces sp. BRFM 1775]|nr:hypothetical protein GY45DRAFT_1367343 [Cubamyces sp. BRFM 1775]